MQDQIIIIFFSNIFGYIFDLPYFFSAGKLSSTSLFPARMLGEPSKMMT